jgi:hypothetical protein
VGECQVGQVAEKVMFVELPTLYQIGRMVGAMQIYPYGKYMYYKRRESKTSSQEDRSWLGRALRLDGMTACYHTWDTKNERHSPCRNEISRGVCS